MAVKRVILQHFSMRYDYMKERPNIYQPSQAYIDAYSDENYNPKPPAQYVRSRSQRTTGISASSSSYGGRLSTAHGHRNSSNHSRQSSRNASEIYNTSGGFKTLLVHEEDDDDEALEAFGRLDEDVDDEWAQSTRRYQQEREMQQKRQEHHEPHNASLSEADGDEDVDKMREREGEDCQHYKHYWRELDEEEGDDYLYEQQHQRADGIAEEDEYDEEGELEGDEDVDEDEVEDVEKNEADNQKQLLTKVVQIGVGTEVNGEQKLMNDDDDDEDGDDEKKREKTEQLIMDNMLKSKQSEFAKPTTVRNVAQEMEIKTNTKEVEAKQKQENDDVDGAPKQRPTSSDISATTITNTNVNGGNRSSNSKLQATPVTTATQFNGKNGDQQTGNDKDNDYDNDNDIDDGDDDYDVKLLDSISDLNEKLPEIYETAKIVVNSAAVEATATAKPANIAAPAAIPTTAAAMKEATCPPNDYDNDNDTNEDDLKASKCAPTTVAEGTTMRTTFGKQQQLQQQQPAQQQQQQQQADSNNSKQQRSVYFALDKDQNDEDADEEDDDYDDDDEPENGPKRAGYRSKHPQVTRNVYTRRQRQQQQQQYYNGGQPRADNQENWRYRSHQSEQPQQQQYVVAAGGYRKYRPPFSTGGGGGHYGNQQRNYLGSFSHTGGAAGYKVSPQQPVVPLSMNYQQRHNSAGSSSGSGGSPPSDEQSSTLPATEVRNWRQDSVFTPAYGANATRSLQRSQQQIQSQPRIGSGRLRHLSEIPPHLLDEPPRMGNGLSPPSESVLLQRRMRQQQRPGDLAEYCEPATASG